MWYLSAGSGEWPRGVYWTPGERRFVPADYPRPADQPTPPAWLAEDPEPAAKGA